MTDEKYEGYMARLEQEYRDYSIRMCRLSPQEIFDRVDEIRAMKYAYEYLRSKDVPHEELEYIMIALHPLDEVVDFHKSFQSAMWQDNPVAQTVYDIYDKELFSDGNTAFYTNRVPICFHRKMGSVSEILSLPRNLPDDPFRVEKVINLSTKDFAAYANMLDTDQAFITNNRDLMYVDKAGGWHCILVHDGASQRGLLICADGCDYARYSAYVENTRELDLTNIPVEEYSRKNRKRQRKPRQQER